MNPKSILNKYGWKVGAPPKDGKYHLAFVWYWPLHPEEKRGGNFPAYDGGYLRDNFFMRTDGWIGWECIPICYHPDPVIAADEKGPYFVNSDRWNRQFEETLQ